MSDDQSVSANPESELQTRFPTAYTILFLLIVLMAALTWFIPAGQYVVYARNDDSAVNGGLDAVDHGR